MLVMHIQFILLPKDSLFYMFCITFISNTSFNFGGAINYRFLAHLA